MPFDPQEFAAKVSLGEIPSEERPSLAQDALEAGFDGPALVRMAVLTKPSGWEVDQFVPRVLEELKVLKPKTAEAAIFLVKKLAWRILETNEDPLPSLSYFHRLFWLADAPTEMAGLAYADEMIYGGTDDDTRQALREEIANFLDRRASD